MYVLQDLLHVERDGWHDSQFQTFALTKTCASQTQIQTQTQTRTQNRRNTETQSQIHTHITSMISVSFEHSFKTEFDVILKEAVLALRQ